MIDSDAFIAELDAVDRMSGPELRATLASIRGGLPGLAARAALAIDRVRQHEDTLQMKAHDHPAYDAGLAQAADRAFRENACMTVYFGPAERSENGYYVYVRDSNAAAPPAGAVKVCIAQRWDDRTVQLRFDGARSEFRNG